MTDWWVLDKMDKEKKEKAVEVDRPQIEMPMYNPEEYPVVMPEEAPKEERGVVVIEF